MSETAGLAPAASVSLLTEVSHYGSFDRRKFDSDPNFPIPHSPFISNAAYPTAAGCFGAGCSLAPNSVSSARLIAACRVAASIFAPRRSVT